MPDPRTGESRAEFVSRYMGDAKAVRDYPDEKQRYMVAISTWKHRLRKQLAEVGPGGLDGHRHSYPFGATRTGAEPGHDHEVRPGSVRTELANGHDHALPAGDYRARATIKGMDDKILTQFQLYGEIEKVDLEERVVYGWFSVIEENGNPVVDKQGDVIDEAELVDAIQKFVSDSRRGKAMHRGRKASECVQALVFTKDVQEALGIDLGRVGAFGAFKVHDDATWERVKSGEFTGFSIGGLGKRSAYVGKFNPRQPRNAQGEWSGSGGGGARGGGGGGGGETASETISRTQHESKRKIKDAQSELSLAEGHLKLMRSRGGPKTDAERDIKTMLERTRRDAKQKLKDAKTELAYATHLAGVS